MNFESLRKSIAGLICFSILTCGIYYIVWFITITNRVAECCKTDERCPSGGIAFLLSIVTCGIYDFYWLYVMSKKADAIRTENGLASRDDATLNLILAIFGFAIISACLIQDNLNKIADDMAGKQPAAAKEEVKSDDEF